MAPGPRASCCTPMTGNDSIRHILQLFIFLSFLLGLVGTTTAWADDGVDIDEARWSNRNNQQRVDGEDAPDNSTVTIRYGEKDDNGAVIGTTRADGDGDWDFRISRNELGSNPVPCDVTAVDDDECRQCHGNNGQGTVLSRMAEDRVLECKDDTSFCPNGNSVLFPKGLTSRRYGCRLSQLALPGNPAGPFFARQVGTLDSPGRVSRGTLWPLRSSDRS